MREISKKHSIPYKLAKNIVDDIFAAIEREVKAGNEVRITNFGKFFAKRRAPRTARNLGHDEEIRIPACWIPFFSPSDNFRYIGEIKHDNENLL